MKLKIGLGSCGIAAGADELLRYVNEYSNLNNIEIEVQKTGCIGMCFAEPVLEIVGKKSIIYGNVTKEILPNILDGYKNGQAYIENIILTDDPDLMDLATEISTISSQKRIVLKNCGIIDPESIEEYIERDGYNALKQVIAQNDPDKVISDVIASGLRGRGGGGFPTGVKWKLTREAIITTQKEGFIICNADEGDPGAFMDRSILEGDPHSVIEGMIIAAFAIGASSGYIYIRAEYPLAIKHLEIALQKAYQHNLLGENIVNSDFSFDLYIKEGAGAFVCGEETALMASIEGKRGMPTLRPPYPAQSGLWKYPTNINNVETFANIPSILYPPTFMASPTFPPTFMESPAFPPTFMESPAFPPTFMGGVGGGQFTSLGTPKSKGTKVFALAGKIKKSGLIEVPMGIPLRDIIFKIGGGMKTASPFKAVQLGGPSGGCIPESLLDTPVDYESLVATGAIMGSGGMVVMDYETCMVDVARYFLSFTQKESCGKCTFCRIGTRRMLEILERIVDGRGRLEDLDTLHSLAISINQSSLCGLGQTAPNPVLTTLKYFRNEYEAHIIDQKCPAGVCKALINYTILENKCVGCTLCRKACPVSCIVGNPKQIHIIDQTKCIKCGMCIKVCKFGAVIT